MKLTSVEFHPDGSSDVMELSFRDPGRDLPYNVKAINGLDADEIVSQFYGAPGTVSFFNMVMVKRTVVALMELNPDYAASESPASLRDRVYKMIAASRKGLVHIWFKNEDTVVATISGYFGKVEAPLFTDTPEIQLTIACDEPLLKAPDLVSIPVIALDPTLTVITDDISTAPHGFKFEMSFSAPVASFIMSDPDDDDWEFVVTPSGGFLIGDVLYYSSEYNDKYIYIVRGGNTIQVADVIQMSSVWPVIYPGENKFAISSGASMDWDEITYYPTFWGV
jgi:hypothetical protein